MPYPSEVKVFHTPCGAHDTSITYVAALTFSYTWHVNKICQFHRLVREIRKLEFWKPSDNLKSWLDPEFCPYKSWLDPEFCPYKSWLDPEFCPYKSLVDIRCSHAASVITSDQLATKHSQQGLDWPTHDFLYPADCLFNNTC